MPVRTCIGCRVPRAQVELLRFHRRSDGVVVAAPAHPRGRGARAGGRSAYLCPRRPCFEQARKRRGFARAFARSGRVDPNFDISELIAAARDELSRELALLERTAADPATHPRRRGREALLFELSSQPATPEQRSGSAKTEADVSTEKHDPRRKGGVSHG